MANARVGFFVPSLRGGGAERVIVTLANGFAAKGYKVDLVLAGGAGEYLVDVSAEVRIIDLTKNRVSASLMGLARYLGREQPDILLSAMSHANVVALLARRLARCQTRLIVSEHYDLSAEGSTSHALRDLLLRRLMRWTYGRAEGIVAVSMGVAEGLESYHICPREAVTVIYNPACDPVLVERGQQAVDHPWFLAGEPPVVIGVGRLVPQKNFETLIKAFALLVHERPARLLILGEGDDRPKLEALVDMLEVQEYVQLPGFDDNPHKYVAKAATFVLSSIFEGFGNVLVEAMAVGTPVVSTNCRSGPAEILEDGKWGNLVPVGDVQALASAIDRSLDSPRGQAIRRAQEFTLAPTLEAYERVFGLC